MALAREAVGPGIRIAVDANQRWGVAEADDRDRRARALGPVLGRGADQPGRDPRPGRRSRPPIAPIKIAVGEHVANRVIFKQILQAGAADVLTIDACRVAGVNENVAILLLAAKFGVPVCPHAGGVGLCEMVQHLAMFDFVARLGVGRPTASWSTSITCTSTSPTRCASPAAGTSRRPAPGFSATLRPQSLRDYEFPARRRLAAARTVSSHQESDTSPARSSNIPKHP